MSEDDDDDDDNDRNDVEEEDDENDDEDDDDDDISVCRVKGWMGPLSGKLAMRETLTYNPRL